MEEVLTHSGGVLDGQTTYRLPQLSQRDGLLSCVGDAANPLGLSTEDWYNDGAATTWNAQGISPLFLTFFPDLPYDSFSPLRKMPRHLPQSTLYGLGWNRCFCPIRGRPRFQCDGRRCDWWSVVHAIQGLRLRSHVAFAGADLKIDRKSPPLVIAGQAQLQSS